MHVKVHIHVRKADVKHLCAGKKKGYVYMYILQFACKPEISMPCVYMCILSCKFIGIYYTLIKFSFCHVPGSNDCCDTRI